MTRDLLSFLRCPVTKSTLQLQVINTGNKTYGNREVEIITEAILYAEQDWFYPVIGGIPRLLVESFIDYSWFFEKHLPDYKKRCYALYDNYGTLINDVVRKNRKTKRSFEHEWRIVDYETDKLWNADPKEMVERFFKETGESDLSIRTKIIFDVGCGNGHLTSLIAARGATILGMDISKSIEEAFQKNKEPKALFIQGDLQFPPVREECFDIVHCSGVLIHTNDTRRSFLSVEPCVKKNGKLSIWLYHPRKDKIHNLILKVRKITSKLPIALQRLIYKLFFLPPLAIVKFMKGKRAHPRELMVALMDQFSPEFRWEHTSEEAEDWFIIKDYRNIRVTTRDVFGYNITGIKNK